MNGGCDGEKEKYNLTEDHPDAVSTTIPHLKEPEPVSTQLKLDSKPCIIGNLICDTVSRHDENPYQEVSLVKQRNQLENNSVDSRGVSIAFNARSSSSSVGQSPIRPYRNLDHLTSKEVSECASSISPLEEKSSLRLWKEMKQNGFLSCSHGGTSVPTKPGRKRKSNLLKEKQEFAKKQKSNLLKEKQEFAKKQQVDRFAKLAAPSGLLSGLNPGIINHVRNSKQVHSIIEALAKSERDKAVMDGSEESSHVKTAYREVRNRKDLRIYDLEDENERGLSDLVGKPNSRTQCTLYNPLKQDYTLRKKSSLSVPVQSMFMPEHSANPSSITSLTVKAATVASQWLQLLHQDIKGRLVALRRSKERVNIVINTELPSLILKEFSPKQEDDQYIFMQNHAGKPDSASVDMHRLKWISLFDQMGKALLEEEQRLELLLKQVREMEVHCESGLRKVHYHAASRMQKPRTTDNVSREINMAEGEVAVRAAAASIYSTCNFLLSQAGTSCC